MKLFLLSSDKMPNIFSKHPTKEDALKEFESGFSEKDYKEFVNDPSFTIIEIRNLEHFLAFIEDNSEFQINDDGSF